jgi:hypothetical protein
MQGKECNDILRFVRRSFKKAAGKAAVSKETRRTSSRTLSL